MAPLTGNGDRRGGENEALALLGALLPPPPPGEVWAGDDAAVLKGPGGGPVLLLAADALVAGLDADLRLTSLADFGWKALAVNLSDIAAMGGEPGHAVVSVVGLGPKGLESLYEGLLAAAGEYGCPIVGGDLSGGREVVVSVAVTGWVAGPPVLRSGARPGDLVWVTGALGGAAAGLRLARQRADRATVGSSGTGGDGGIGGDGTGGGGDGTGAGGTGAGGGAGLVRAHARPRPALKAGRAARLAGATAMIDVSDGFSADLARLARSSGVGVELDAVPVVEGATADEAMGGGDDYVLIFTSSPSTDVLGAFAAAGVPGPTCVGRCTAGPIYIRLAGKTVGERGWEHLL